MLRRSLAFLLVVSLMLPCIAGCSAIGYTVSFSTSGNGVEPIKHVKSGATVKLPTPAREGFIFKGWFYSVDRVEYEFTEETPVTGDVFLYAKYERDVSEYDNAVIAVVSASPNAQKFDALGVEWDPHFFREFNSSCNYDDWEMIVSRARELSLSKIRVMVLPSWFEPENDNDDPALTDMSAFDFTTTAFDSLLQELDVAQELGIEVNLTLWGADMDAAWLAYTTCGDWLSAPNDPEEYAENISALLDFIFNVRKYTCVTELTLHNEPSWAFKGADGSVDFDYYVECCRAVDSRLKADGLRDRVKLILSDDTSNNFTWLKDSVAALSDIADGFNSHTYDFDNRTSNTSMFNWAKKRVDAVLGADSGLSYTINEFGSNHTVGAYHQSDIDDFERGIFCSRLVENCLNAGVAGMLHWEFFDMYYYDGPRDEAVMSTGLFKYKDEGWTPRPLYYAYGLMMKYCVSGSEIYPLSFSDTDNSGAPADVSRLSGTMLLSPEGKLTYLITNDSDSDITMVIQGSPTVSYILDTFVYSESSLPTDGELPDASGTATASEGSIYLSVPAGSFVLLSDLFNVER